MQEVWLMGNSALLGAVLAWIIIDFSYRKIALKNLIDTKKEMEDIMASIQTVHNQLSEKVLGMEEKVSAHDYQLNARKVR